MLVYSTASTLCYTDILLGILATRLSDAGVKYNTASTLCYIVSMDMEKVLELWIKETCTPDQLQVGLIVIIRFSMEFIYCLKKITQ